MAHRYNSEEAARARRQRGGLTSVRVQAAAGIDTAARMREAKQRRRALDNALRAEADALLDTRGSQLEQLRRIARAENHAPDADDADAGVILDGI